MTNEIQKIENRPGFQAVAVLDRHSENLTPQQLQAIPMIAYGTSISRVSDYLKVPYQTVLQWSRTDYKFRMALEEFRQYVGDYHNAMLNQTAVYAWDRVFEFLTQTFDEDDKDNRNLQAQMARFVIGELGLKNAGRPQNINLNVSTNAIEPDSIDVVARRIVQLRTNSDEIDAEYKIAAPTIDKNTEMNSIATSVLVDAKDGITENEFSLSDEEPQYVMHPNAKHGELRYDRERKKWLCHICGAWSHDLVVHIRIEHNLSPARYKKMYGLPSDIKFYHQEIEQMIPEEVENLLR